MAQPSPRVIIAGGGPAGLLFAQALQIQGASVTVYEQDAAIDSRPRDWDFSIYWAQTPLAKCLPEHLANLVESCQVDDHRAGADELMRVYNAQTEELMATMPTPYMIRLGRRKFVAMLSQGLDIKHAKGLKSVSSDGKQATATFEDGTTASGDFLIGAEGTHSVVRSFLVGPEKAKLRPLQLVASVTVAKLPVEAALEMKDLTNRLLIAVHPDEYWTWVGVHDAPEDSKPGEWTFMFILGWIPSEVDYDASKLQGEKILADIKKRASCFGDRSKFIWQSIPDGTRCWHNQLSYWHADEPWDNHNGSVTMIGDAAHPMTFHRGQGLNNAIFDVAALAEQFQEKGFTAAAVTAYEEAMIPRSQKAVVESRENSLAMHEWDKILGSQFMCMGVKRN